MSLGKIADFKNAKIITANKNNLGLSDADLNFDLQGPPTLDDVVRRQYLGQIGEGDILTNTTKDFFNGKPYNRLHDFNSYNCIFTLLSLSPFQKNNPNTFQGKVHAEGNGKWGLESREFYTVLRSGGYNRNTISSAYNEDLDYSDDYNTTPTDTQTFNSKTGRFSEGSGATKAGENKKKDLYIENVKFKSYMNVGNHTGTNLPEGTFEVHEPHGVGGFYEELFFASQFAGYKDYHNASFLLVLSFVGRKAGEANPVIIPQTTRYFPIMITHSNMTVTEAGATYSVQFKGEAFKSADPALTRTRDNIKSPDVDVPSVGKILLHLFTEHNKIVEDITKKQFPAENVRGEEIEVNQVQQQRAIDLAQSGSNGQIQVGKNLPHRYCIWFPKSYSKYSKANSGFDKDGYTEFGETQYDEWGDEYQDGFTTGTGKEFPSNLADISYDAWLSYSKDGVDKLQGRYFEEGDEKKNSQGKTTNTFIAKGERLKDYSNYISASRMKTGELAYSDMYYVPDIDAEQTKRDEQLKPLIDALNEAKIDAQATKDAADLAKQDLEAIKKKYQTEDGEFNEDNLSDSEKKDYNIITDSYLKKFKEMNEAEKVVKEREAELAEVKKNTNTTAIPNKISFFGKNRSTWQFRKGKTLRDIIHQVILDSVYVSNLFTNQSEWSKVLKDGMIPWYRIETLQKTIGFDTIKNAPVYEFHYIIVPYQIHYSELPGLTDGPLNYKHLERKCVREYNYIFTGKNLDVLNLDLQYDNLFRVPTNFKSQQAEATNTDNQPKQNEKLPESDVQKLANMVGSPAKVDADEINNDQGSGKPTTNQGVLARQLHDKLYSGQSKDLVNIDMTVVGDPVYLIGSGNVHRPGISVDGLETDQGEANCFDRAPHIKVNIGFPSDTPTSEELKNGQYTQAIKYSRFGGIYEVIEVDHDFEQGVFKQILKCKRKPNQSQDYQEEVVVKEPQFAEEPKQGTENAPDDQIEKADKDPKVKLDGESKENLGEQGTSTLEKAGGFVVETVSDIGTGIGNIITSVGEGITGAVNTVSDGVTGTLGKIYNSIAGEGAEGNQNQDANDGNDTGGPR